MISGQGAQFSSVALSCRGTLGSSLRSPAEGEGNEVFPPPPEKDLESPSSMRLDCAGAVLSLAQTHRGRPQTTSTRALEKEMATHSSVLAWRPGLGQTLLIASPKTAGLREISEPQTTSTRLYTGGELQGSPVWQALAGHKRSFPLAVVLPPPARGAGTLIPSAQRFVWVEVFVGGRRETLVSLTFCRGP